MEFEKTFRFIMVCVLAVVLGFFYFLFKVEACKSTPDTCKDSFHSLNPNRYSDEICDIGAIAEVINSPPAPKAGILCHCVKDHTAPAGSSSVK